MWLRENCKRMPDWLDQAASGGREKVEITSDGDVIWHRGIFYGLWKGGTWKNGSFFGERWEDGYWKAGFWQTDLDDWITGFCDVQGRKQRSTNAPAHRDSQCDYSDDF